MASVSHDKLSPAEKEQLAISYASFVISGSGSQVTADSLNAVIKASGLTVGANLVNAFAKTLKGKKATDFIGSVGSSSSAPVVAKGQAPVAK
jgi:ribosomal protein L12E/L44/L45/RPP1/RPP2